MSNKIYCYRTHYKKNMKEKINNQTFYCNRAGNVKCCEHPETLAVRGLLLLGLGKTQEAEDSVKRGLKNNLR
jgi:hypothetical protein